MGSGTPAERLTRGLERKSSGCLEWTGGTDACGYGKIWVNGRVVGTHRLAWTLNEGPIPPGVHVLHHCDNPPCAETEGDDHLFLGTPASNAADKVAKGRHNNGNRAKTHCPDNHAYDEANTYVDPNGWRYCRMCYRAKVARRRSAPPG